MRLQQHVIFLHFLRSSGSGKQQIGHSPRQLSSGWLNNSSSRIAAAIFLHAFLCCDRWFFWQTTPQYLTRLHAQFLSLMLSTAALPQHAHTSSAASTLLMMNIDLWIENMPSQQAQPPTNMTPLRRVKKHDSFAPKSRIPKPPKYLVASFPILWRALQRTSIWGNWNYCHFLQWSSASC